ncbi:translocation/assembly module TamB domain-containing protein [Arenibacter sp. BSSL-BM3]|uniref:Translocation/assembly module TamB domain-containing protein n=1 Tax=Arenibacter arenosicollis TaxID=2762274 RepID=A0ABR7QLF3_9FLAO|nr:translocation/assembly module TamB domain-containing protein [Arenibacter arenosicollis]MBC8767760.1 translocation/assembly module TamB domain-containing protein [Arenibacter arenosicollis]
MKITKSKYRFLRGAAKVVLVLALLFIVLVLFVRSPWGQNIIVSKVTSYVANKTNTKVEIDRLFITFSGNAFMEGLYLEDQKGDTLLFSKSLEANIPLSPLLFGNELNLKSVEWDGLRAHIDRNGDSGKFNFDFLLEALATNDTTPPPPQVEPMKINVGSLNFSNFKIDYNDAYSGVEAGLILGQLYLNSNTVDLETMLFNLEDLELSDTNITYKQTKPFVPEDNTQTPLPFLVVNNLKLKNVRANYNSIPDGVLAKASIGDFVLELSKADLSKKELEIGLLSLKDSDISLNFQKEELTPKDITGNTAENVELSWPELFIVADNIVLNNNSVHYRSANNATTEGQFNPNDIFLSKLNLEANDLNYQPKNGSLKLDQLSFVDKSGFQLQNLVLAAKLDDSSATLTGLQLNTNSSWVTANMKANYQSLNQLIHSPGKTKMDLQMSGLHIALQDALFFQPNLSENEYFSAAQQHPFTGKLEATGILDDIAIQNLLFNWGNSSLMAEGTLSNLMETDSLTFDFPTLNVTTIRGDLQQFVAEKDLNIDIPQTILVQAKTQGNLKNISGEAFLKIPEGTAKLNGNYSSIGQINFDGNLQVDSLKLGKLLRNEQLGLLTFKIKASGSGNSLNTLNAIFESDFTQLELKKYDFSNLELKGKIQNGKGDIDMKFKDKNLNFQSNTALILDSISSKIKLNLNVIGADLLALGITKANIKAGLDLEADFDGNMNNYGLNVQINNGVAVYDGQQYQMGHMQIKSKIDTLSTEVNIKSDFLNGGLKSNTSPTGINTALTKQFKSYFDDTLIEPSPSDSVKLEMDLNIHPNALITEVFLRDLEQMDSIIVRANFDAATKNINARLKVPSAKYKGITLDSMNLSAIGDSTNLNFTAGIINLIADPVHIKRTYLEGTLKNKELLLDFSSWDEKEKVVFIASKMILARDTTLLQINPEGLLFNKKEWLIPQDNQITFAPDHLGFKNVNLTRNSQQLSLSNSASDSGEEHLAINFDQFRLQTFLSLFNPDSPLASGLVNGNLIIENPYGATGIVADYKISDLEIMQHPLGNLSLKATSKTSDTYDFNLALKGGGADIDLKGDYAAAETGAKLNLDLDLNRIDLKVIEDFSFGTLKDTHGYLSGKIDVSGTTTSPVYTGTINFNETDFNVASLNSVFKISDETLKIDTDGVYLDNFQITDANGSIFKLDGSIGTKELLNPKLDLSVNAKQFQFLNSTEKDNELFYGKASFDVDLTVKGHLKLPIIDGNLRVREGTDVTYVVPESQLDVEEREGVVIFVNRENPNAILTRNDNEETAAFFRGLDVKAILEIADDSNFNIIIDKRTGDNLRVSGDASLNLNVEPNGRMQLTGRYELNSGHYETNLYNLVKRRFLINPNSTITWQGEPTNAKLDVTATYTVETSAAPLMSSVISSEDNSLTGKYRQVLPFLVYLNVDGELLEPKLSFGLDMPEDEQGSLGGAVYGRVQQLNQQEAELNKQVFSLLALNRFYPDSGSDGSIGGTAAIARDNVNKVLSGELNAFSDRVFGQSGFEVDFDLDSFTDYQGESPQDRTQLNINAKKKLFNDRLIVTAGSAVDVEGSAQPGQEETPIIGNVSLEYLLTKDGRYRLRGFRKNEYENIIDGQLIVTGVALIFNREFNRFSQLFNPLKEVKTAEEKDKEIQKKE